MFQQINIGEDNLIEFDSLRYNATGALASGATVTAELFEADGVTSIATCTMAETASPGTYQGSLAAADLAGLVSGTFYQLVVTASGTADALRHCKCVAAYHRELP